MQTSFKLLGSKKFVQRKSFANFQKMSKSEALYERMRNAIQRGDHALMWEISEDSDYDVNREDKAGLGRVALHTAVQKND